MLSSTRRRPPRFGSGVVSLPLWLRLAVTAPFALLGVGLLVSLVRSAQADDPRPAALSLLLFGLVGRLAWVLLPSVWHSTAEWQKQENAAHLLERRLKDALDDRVRSHPGLVSSGPQPSDVKTDNDTGSH
jgi:hypothetical protein